MDIKVGDTVTLKHCFPDNEWNGAQVVVIELNSEHGRFPIDVLLDGTRGSIAYDEIEEE